jgi:hypothetical protein
MPQIAYIEKKFSPASIRVIEQANEIIEIYAAQGFDLTLRQLYYQFVSRDLIPNRDSEYKRLGAIVSDARLAGLIDWEAIVDRTRNLRQNSHWREPGDIISSAAYSYAIDKWEDQDYRPEVWIEKDALVGVIEDVCERLDVPYFSCRGYTSQSEMWVAAQRLEGYTLGDQIPIIFHLGDHDPSGQDMTRDIFERLDLFMGGTKVERLALNYDQILRYNPPPNPTKLTDSRATGYINRYGRSSWELDALEPAAIANLIEQAVLSVRDEEKWAAALAREQTAKQLLTSAARRWRDVATFLGDVA